MPLPFMSYGGDGYDDVEARRGVTPISAPSSSSSSSSPRPYGINDAWDTPTNSNYNSFPPHLEIPGPSKENKRVVPRQVFHMVASLLIISMVMLLVELRTPGFAVHMGQKLSTLWGKNRIASNMTGKGTKSNMRGGHIPPDFELLDAIIGVPTSEPTQLIGSYKWANAGGRTAPTSEPTEYRTFGDVIVAPTSEPTEFIRDEEDPNNLPPPPALAVENGTPTPEPTMFDSGSAEPTMFNANSAEPTMFNANSAEPTIFNANSAEPTMFNANSAEPTMFHANTVEPTQFFNSEEEGSQETEGGEERSTDHTNSNDEGTHSGNGVTPTSEPTVFNNVNMPPVSSGTEGGNHEAIPTSEPTIFYSGNKSSGGTSPGNQVVPTSEPTIFNANIPEVHSQPTSEPTIFNANIPEVAGAPTSEPTIFNANIPEVPESTPTPTESRGVSIAPTNDPTQYPTPTPTEATLLGYIGESIGDVFENIF